MSKLWPYADKRWWACAVYQAVKTVDLGHESVMRMAQGFEAPTAEAVADYYTRTLSVLAGGSLTPGHAAHLLFLAKALKKWRISSCETAQRRSDEAIQGFVRRNAEAASFRDPPDHIVWLMRQLLASWLPPVAPEEFQPLPSGRRLLITGRFGPGAVAEHYTHPQRLERLAEWSSDPHWPEVRIPTGGDMDHIVSRLCAVPKDETKDRLITVEPAYHSFVQQYVRDTLLVSIHNGPLRGTCMDLGYVDGPQIQRKRALRASENGVDATVDLSDASDRISWRLVQLTFPAWIVDLLAVCRSDYFTWAEGRGASQYTRCADMHIYAGMGNATTFPVETLFFTAYVVATARHAGLRPRVSVFGDDIICSSNVAELLIANDCDFFRVNRQKSFWGKDALRESCGVFAYKGIDITAPRVDGYPDTWEGRLGLSTLWRTLKESPWSYGFALSYAIASGGFLPNYERAVPGYPAISDPRVSSVVVKSRYNRETQETEYRLPCREQKRVSYQADDATAAARNTPTAKSLLCGVYTSVIRSATSWRSARSATRCTGPSAFAFPSGRYRVRVRWVLAEDDHLPTEVVRPQFGAERELRPVYPATTGQAG